MNDIMIELIRCCLLPNRIPSNHFMCLTVFLMFPTLRLNDTPDQNSKDQRLTRTTIYFFKNQSLVIKVHKWQMFLMPF